MSQRPEAARRKNSLSKASPDMHAAVTHSDMAFLRVLGQGLYNPEADDAGITPKKEDSGYIGQSVKTRTPFSAVKNT